MQGLIESLPLQRTVNRGRPVPHSSVRIYPDAEAAETAYLATKVELTPVGRSPFTMHVVRV